MSDARNGRPEGFHSVTPHMVVKDVPAAIAFYEKVFGAKEALRMPTPDGSVIMHAEIEIGDSRIMMGEEMPDWGALSPLSLGGTPLSLHLYVADVDAIYAAALAEGATGKMPPADMFWGDRYAQVVDPFGHSWAFAKHLRDPSPEEIEEGMKAAMAGPPEPA
ncbi:VOC family protein [Pelagibius sp.]|uniref:VOC family protein n=1 Tax=Pelagibius sp. TaxID=1931238 RepID=UPI0026122989|nr:VOC family protein [Pelagibius sp.]